MHSRNVEHLPLVVSAQNYIILMRMTLFLYSNCSDIDLMVDWPGHIWGRETMRQLGRHIERSGIGRGFQYIFGAKVFPNLM